MIQHVSSGRRHRNLGFTLIELLVVVVILGIISGVVVFAVRGMGNKGRDEALATDKRTLRTAQEAFCARFGRYAENEAQLVNPKLADESFPGKGFLSEESELHDIRPARDDEPRPCNDTGYVIEEVDDGDSDDPPGPGSFDPTNVPVFSGSAGGLLQLPDGHILAYKMNPLDFGEYAVYNPASETWVPAANGGTLGPTSFDANDMVLLEDDPGTVPVDCGANCGKVLVHIYDPAGWWHFTPVGGSGALQPVPGASSSYSTGTLSGVNPVLLKDDPTTPGVQCGNSCGKVFISTFRDNYSTGAYAEPIAELYDPATNDFVPVLYPPGLAYELDGYNVTRMRDGRVFMWQGTSVYAFDPIDNSFTKLQSAPNFLDERRPTMLPNGDLLFTPDNLFRPGARYTKGTWLKSGECEAETSQACRLLAPFPDGRALAHVTAGYPSVGPTRLFNSSSRTWKSSANLPEGFTAGPAVFIDPARGGCGSNCEKVLVVGTTGGSTKAYLYTPPS